MLTGRGGHEAELPIPPTIAALLSARLDRLGPGERAVIARAAVVGKEFSAEATVELLPEDARAFAARHLETLARKELIEPASSPGRGESFRFRHILIQQAAYRRPRSESRGRSFTSASPHGSATPRAAGSPSTLRSSATTSSRRFATGPSWVRSASRSSSWRGGPATILPPPVSGRSSAETCRRRQTCSAAPRRSPTLEWRGRPRGAAGAGLRAVRDRRGGRGERRARRRSSEGTRRRASGGVEWRVTITRARIEMYRDPEGIDLEALAAETETAIEVLGELGDEAGLARAWMVLSDLHWSKGRLRRDERCCDPGGGACAASRQSPRGRLGARAERLVRDPRPDAGRRGSELARAVAPSGAGEPHPGCEPVGLRHRARGDERPFRRGPRAHRGQPRPGARPRPDVAGGRPGAAQRLRRAAGRRPGRRRARHADGRAGLPRDRRGVVPVDRRGRSAARRLRAGAL